MLELFSCTITTTQFNSNVSSEYAGQNPLFTSFSQ